MGTPPSRRPTRPRRMPALGAWLLTVALGACSNAASPSDAGAFQFVNLRVESIGTTSAVVLFDTSAPSSCEVEYGPSADALDGHATDPSMAPGTLVTTHRVPIVGLTSATTVDYRARAVDAANNSHLSDVSSFRTLSEDVDAGSSNVALLSAGTRVLEVSSNYGNGDNASAYGADNAIDGQLATEWATNGDGDAAYVVLDFGQSRVISRFGYRSRQMPDGTSIVSRVRVIAPELNRELGTFDTPDPNVTYAFDINPAVAVEQLRLEAVQTTGGNTGATEIQFFE
jgi:hypothetical protein